MESQWATSKAQRPWASWRGMSYIMRYFKWPCTETLALIFSLFLSLSVPVQKLGAAPRNICCQLRISVCNFEALSHGPPKLLMTLQSPAERGSRRCVSLTLAALRFSKGVRQVIMVPHVGQGCAHRKSSRLIWDQFCYFLCNCTNEASPGTTYRTEARLVHMCWSTNRLRFCLMGKLGLVLDQHIKMTSA